MSEKLEHHVASGKNDPAANYALTSILFHWLGAIAIIFLFISHEDDFLIAHISIGLLLTIPLIARVIYRWTNGFPRASDQHPALNFIERLVMIAMLVSILIIVISGIFIPLFAGQAYTFFEIVNWTVPYSGNQNIHAFLEEAHDIAGHAIIPLFGLHLLGFLKHMLVDKKSSSRTRMLKPFRGGK